MPLCYLLQPNRLFVPLEDCHVPTQHCNVEWQVDISNLQTTNQIAYAQLIFILFFGFLYFWTIRLYFDFIYDFIYLVHTTLFRKGNGKPTSKPPNVQEKADLLFKDILQQVARSSRSKLYKHSRRITFEFVMTARLFGACVSVALTVELSFLTYQLQSLYLAAEPGQRKTGYSSAPYVYC